MGCLQLNSILARKFHIQSFLEKGSIMFNTR